MSALRRCRHSGRTLLRGGELERVAEVDGRELLRQGEHRGDEVGRHAHAAEGEDHCRDYRAHGRQ
jgi:hypothetical protein